MSSNHFLLTGLLRFFVLILWVPTICTETNAQVPYGFHFVRTDEDPSGVIYDQQHDRFYVAVPQKNLVYVVTAADGLLVKTISVQSPFDLSLSPDASRLYVSSASKYIGYQVDGFFVVDTSSLTLTDFVSPMELSSFRSNAAPRWLAAMKNGKLLLSTFPDSHTFSYDLNTGVATNKDANPYGGGVVRRSADATRAIVTLSAGSGLTMYDSGSDAYTAYIPTPYYPSEAILNSDGSRVLVDGHLLLDGNLQQLADISPLAAPASGYRGATFSADGTKIYSAVNYQTTVTLSGGGTATYSNPVIQVFDLATMTTVGYIPATHFLTSQIFHGMAVSSTGIGIMLSDRGFVEFDPRSMISNLPAAVGHNFAFGPPISPSTGSLTNPAPVQLPGVGFDSVPSVFFGGNAATNISVASQNFINVQPPSASIPGPVDVTARFPDGWAIYAPEGYSYGPTVLYQDIDSGDVSGGTTVTILGYGLSANNVQPQVTVGGAPASVSSAPFSWTPFTFPIQQLAITTPAGSQGPADIVITTSFGSFTIKNGFHYITHRIASNVSPIEMVYDDSRGLVYEADYVSGDVKSIDPRSLAVTTILPAGNEPATALSLTPDMSKLMVVSASGSTLKIVDLATKSVIQTVTLNFVDWELGPDSQILPNSVIPTARGTAIVGAEVMSLKDNGYVYEVDPETGNYSIISGISGITGGTLAHSLFASIHGGAQILITSDLRRNSSGGPRMLWDSSRDALVSRSGGGAHSFSATERGDRFLEDSKSYTMDLSGTIPTVANVDAPNSLLSGTRSLVAGRKLHSSGSLSYLPTTRGVEIYDTNKGIRVRSIGVNGGLAATGNGLVVNRLGDTLVVAEKNGVGIINLDTVPLSVGAISSEQCSPCAGESLSIFGSGFENGATVTIGGQAIVPQFIDSTNLLVSLPSLSGSKLGVTVTNPGGETYTLPAVLDTVAVSQPSPSISSVSPTVAATGLYQELVITGSGFTPNCRAYLGGEVLQTSYLSDTSIAATSYALPGPGVQPINVVNIASGTISNTLNLQVDDPVPLNIGVIPSTAAAGSPDLVVTVVSNSQFAPSSVANWDGVPLTTSFASPSQLNVTIPAAKLANVGTATMTVTDPKSQSASSASASFTIQEPLAKLESSTSQVGWIGQLAGTSATNSNAIFLGSSGNVPVQIQGLVLSDTTNFSQSNTCNASLSPSKSCTITVTFSPARTTKPGPISATLQVNSSSSLGPLTIALNGIVTDFAVQPSASNLSVVGGQAATTQLSVLGYAGMTSTVTMGCAGLPSGASCSFSPSVFINPSADGTPVNLNISTTTQMAAVTPRSAWTSLALLPVVLIVGLIVPKRRASALVCVLFLTVLSNISCGGGGGGSTYTPPPPQPKSYAITVTATYSQQVQRTATINLTVSK